MGLLEKSSKWEMSEDLKGIFNKKGLVEVNGVIHSMMYLNSKDAKLKSAKVSFLLRIRDQEAKESSYFLKVYLNDKYPDWLLPGDVVYLIGKARAVHQNDIPGAFDLKEYYNKHRIIGNLNIRSNEGIKKIRSGNTISSFFYKLRRKIHLKFQDSFSSHVSSFLSSILLGYKKTLSNEQTDNFRTLGISHILAISGLHMGLLAFIFWSVLRFFRCRESVSCFSTFGISLFYCCLSGGSASTVRALVMICVLLFANLAGRRNQFLNSLCFSFCVICLSSPWAVYAPGLQLSFLAVFIIYLAQPFLYALKLKDEFEVFYKETAIRKITRYLTNLGVLTLVISIGLMFVVATFFHQITPLSPLMNMIFLPLFTILLVFVFVVGVGVFVLPSILIVPIGEGGLSLFLSAVQFLNKAFSLSWFVKTPSLALTVFSLGVLAFLLSASMSKGKKISCLLIMYLLQIFFLRIPFREKEGVLTLLSVGKASACNYYAPDSGHLLFDWGTPTGFDSINDYLKEEGVNDIASVFISHDNFDHFSCWRLPENKEMIQKVYFNRPASPSAEFEEWSRVREKKGRPFLSLKSDHVVYKGESTKIDFIDLGNKDTFSENNASQVLLLQWGQIALLNLGDLQEKGIGFLTKRKKIKVDNKLRVLVYPHHGRNWAGVESLLNWYRPDMILISGSRVPVEVKRILKPYKDCFNTYDYGSLRLKANGELKSFKDGKWSVLRNALSKKIKVHQ